MILIDTGPLVALCDPRDSLHASALRDLKALASSQLGICEPVLCEVCFHLAAPSQRRRLYEVIQRLNILPAPVDDEQSLWKDVFDWLHKYAAHDPDWTDGYLAVLCGRDRKYKVWTYDSEFQTVWRRPNGTAIPLAVPI